MGDTTARAARFWRSFAITRFCRELPCPEGSRFAGLEDAFLSDLLDLVDLLVDGPYLQSQRDLRLRFRGSRNQRVLDLPASLKAEQAVWAAGYQ